MHISFPRVTIVDYLNGLEFQEFLVLTRPKHHHVGSDSHDHGRRQNLFRRNLSNKKAFLWRLPFGDTHRGPTQTHGSRQKELAKNGITTDERPNSPRSPSQVWLYAPWRAARRASSPHPNTARTRGGSKSSYSSCTSKASRSSASGSS